ncbi:MAG: hypothetical protein ABIN95_08790 [Mucilaginibacter sp.]
MKSIFLMLIFCCIAKCLQAQEPDLAKIADSIQTEGETLYKSEWASWYGSDIFLEQCKSKAGSQAGYISYDNGKGLVNIFFSKDAEPLVLATTTFAYGFDPQKYTLDTVQRKLNKTEKELHTIRQTVIKAMRTDTIYKSFKNSSLNPVPLIYKGNKKVYALTGPNINGVVLFGNDYLVTFNKDNKIKSTVKLHNSLIPIEYTKSNNGNTTVLASVHNHVKNKSEFITVTDICTIMLYEKFTTWNQCVVLSEKYTSIWDCKKNNLKIIPRSEWEKMNPLKNALEGSKN